MTSFAIRQSYDVSDTRHVDSYYSKRDADVTENVTSQTVQKCPVKQQLRLWSNSFNAVTSPLLLLLLLLLVFLSVSVTPANASKGEFYKYSPVFLNTSTMMASIQLFRAVLHTAVISPSSHHLSQ